MTREETKNKYIYTINDLTDGEIRSIEYAYGQFIHNAVSGDFAETNGIMDAFRARIKKKPIQATSLNEDFITIPKPKFKVGDEVNVIVKEYEQVFDIDSGFMVDYGAPFISKMQGWIEELNHYDHVHKQHYYLVRLKGKKDSAEYEYYPEDELEYNK